MAGRIAEHAAGALATLALLVGALPLVGQGAAGFELLQVPVAARPAGLGGAYTAVGPDLDGVWYNPAAIAGVRAGASISRLELRDLFDQTAVTAGLRLAGGTLALSGLVQRFQPIPATDETGESVGEVAPQTVLAGVSYGRSARGLAFGASIRAIRSDLTRGASAADAAAASSAFALDIGLSARMRLHEMPVAAGVALLDAGSSFHFQNADDPLPTRLRAGIALGPAGLLRDAPGGLSALLAVDAVESLRGGSRKPEVSAGGELCVARVLWLRAGLMAAEDEPGHPFRLGLGVAAGRIHIDLARRMSAHPALGEEWSATLGLPF